MAAMLGMAAVTSLVGCGKGTNAVNKGAATLNVRTLLQVTDAKSAKVAVQGAAESVNLTIPLVANATSTQWSAIVSDLPIGSDYVFTASAFAADGTTVLYTGAVSGQSILKNALANIVIDMNQVAASVGFSDEAPKIAGLTETASCVAKGDSVTIKATAFDTDAGDTAGMAWNWSVDATCGTLSAPVNVAGTDTTSGTSTVTFTATSTSANCQVNLTVADARQPAVLMTTGSVTISIGASCALGNAKITAIPNTCPVVANVGASVVPVQNTPSYVPMVVGQSTWVSVSATDADNDTLVYSWSSPDCAGGTPATTFGNFNAATNTAGTWFLLTSAPPATQAGCTFLVTVSDGTFADGKPKCSILNHLSLPVKGANDVVKGSPVFGYDYQSTGTVSDGDSVKLEIVAPNTGCTLPYNLTWSPAGTALTTLDPPFTTGITLTAPVGAGANGLSVTVTATCPDVGGLSTVHSFALVGTNAVCNGAADGTDCTTTAQVTDKCVSAAKCSAGNCAVQTSVTCPASTTACQDNVCGHLTDGLCHLQASSTGTACSDGLACTTGEKCAAGACTGGTAVTCTASSSSCQVSACSETSTPPGQCVVTSAADGTTCSDGLFCTTADKCTSGTCGGTATSCAAGFVCSEASTPPGTCVPNAVNVCSQAKWAKDVVPSVFGVAADGAGNVWSTGALFGSYDFGNGKTLTATSSDAFLVKTSGANVTLESWNFGDPALNKDQNGKAIAVAGNSNIGLVGNFNIEIDFTSQGANGTQGVDFQSSTGPSPYYAVIDGASTGVDPTVIQAKAINLGTSGALLSIGSNPTKTVFAVCGQANVAVPAYTTGASNKGLLTPGGGIGVLGGGLDIVVAKIDAATGNVLWGKQIGGAGDQTCNSVAVDGNGDVVIAGSYNGTLNFGSPTTAFPVVSGSKLLYVAKLSGTNGAPLAAQTWGVQGTVTPYVAVDSQNNIAVAGQMTGVGTGITFSTSPAVSVGYAGGLDLFLVKMNSSLVPTCAFADGDSNDQVANGVAFDSAGNMYVVGGFIAGLPALGKTNASITSYDALEAQFNSACVPQCVKTFGDVNGTQSISALSVANASTVPAALANSIFIAGAYSSAVTFDTVPATTIDTGSASLIHNFFSRLMP
jgi:hypothetical protein